MKDGTSGGNPLAALGAHLGAHGFGIELTAQGLKVSHPRGGKAVDTVTCRARAEDGGRVWFYSGSGRPIAEAERIIDAKMVILGGLAARDER
jgi:hypothetical protein